MLTFQIKILFLSFFTSVIVAFIVIPLLKKANMNQTERADGPKSHLEKKGTTTMGGLIMMITTILIGIILFIDYSAEEPEIATRLVPMIFISLGFGVIGFIDDFKKAVLHNTDGLSPKAKMAGLAIIAVCYIALLLNKFKIGTDIFVPFWKNYITLPIWLYIIFSLLVILGTTNAVNLTDGIDGLGASVSTIILLALTVISIILNVKEAIIFCCIVMGSSLGFFLFNQHPAHIFMGDTGSLFLGGAIAGIALYLKMPLILPIIAIIPVIETLSVIIQVSHYKRTGKRIFKMSPIHHHFELSGWSEIKIVCVFSLITIIAGVIGILAIY